MVQVDVRLSKTGGGSDELLRLVELDMQNTSASLNIVRPLTHDKGTPGTGDDLYFWSFSSLANCLTTPSFCGFKHFADFNLVQPAGLPDTRANMLSIAFHGLSAEGSSQLLLPASGTPVTVGKLQATLPVAQGNYTLSMMNPGDVGADRGARVDFGFDPHIIWRDRAIPPDPVAQVTGGTLVFAVGPAESCGTPGGPNVLTWESVNNHTRSGQVPLDLFVPLNIPDNYDNVNCTGAAAPHPCCTGAGTGTCTGSFTEPRSGVKKIVVTFDAPLNPATAIISNVTICGKTGPAPGTPTDLSGVTMTAGIVPGSGDMKMEINFSTRLVNFARYRMALKTTILGAGGGPIQAGTGGLSRFFTALQGDINNDRRVNATDVGGIRSLVPRDPINTSILNEIRGDVNSDRRINATDVGGARSLVGQDARTITDPVCP